MNKQLSEIVVPDEQLCDDELTQDEALSLLQGSSRKTRQNAALVLNEISKHHPESLAYCIPQLVQALEHPEAQTRWCVLDALTSLVPIRPDECEKALDGAEDSLFDERHGIVREKALCFLCRIGARSPELSRMVWPSLDEAFQCYHGNPEFAGMLTGFLEFAQGDLDPSVKAEFSQRIAFDANNTKGVFGKRAQQILSALE